MACSETLALSSASSRRKCAWIRRRCIEVSRDPTSAFLTKLFNHFNEHCIVMKPHQFLSLFLVFIPATIAATPTTSAIAIPSSNPDTLGEGCVDPRNYVKCNTKQQDDFVTCGTRCNVTNANGDCLLGCGVSRDTAVFGCVVESCWNKVGESDYPESIMLIRGLGVHLRISNDGSQFHYCE